MSAQMIAAGTLVVDVPDRVLEDPEVVQESFCLLVRFDTAEELRAAIQSRAVEFGLFPGPDAA